MEEAITFWLDNKICSGFKVAEIGRQTLVSYRDKYYLVENGAARMNGVRPLHYSKTSMPTIWKKAMKGIMPPTATVIEHPEDENLPATTSTKKERTTMQKNHTAPSELAEEQPQVIKPVQAASKRAVAAELKPFKIIQTVVAATCPYCNHKQDLPFEKGKNGKPFFAACVRCSTEFAVRFVPVTMYQAQVAAFK
ncbi:MAG: hypothetical protein HIU83_05595 [Proteobacteria bacterium]|nr:hypothetical protein [Pseudomonadota bacterium]